MPLRGTGPRHDTAFGQFKVLSSRNKKCDSDIVRPRYSATRFNTLFFFSLVISRQVLIWFSTGTRIAFSRISKWFNNRFLMVDQWSVNSISQSGGRVKSNMTDGRMDWWANWQRAANIFNNFLSFWKITAMPLTSEVVRMCGVCVSASQVNAHSELNIITMTQW